jgi:hypothetical protein
MLSFFSRKPFNSKIGYYDTKLSKYVIDTTNKVKKEYPIVPYTNNNDLTNINTNMHSFIPIISMLSFLAGYYLSKYNS